MTTPFLPLQLLLLTFGAWVNRKQALIIDYIREENRVLKEQLGGGSLRAMGLVDEVDGFLNGKRFLIIDRDSKFTAQFKELLKGAGIKIILAPFQAPNANAFAERFIRSIKHECLNRMIHFGNRSLCRSLNEYVAHYNTERNHQGVGNELLSGIRPVGSGRLIVKERLGGYLKFYHRSAA